jgi:hypothetical protein
MWQRIDPALVARIGWDSTQTGQCVRALNLKDVSMLQRQTPCPVPSMTDRCPIHRHRQGTLTFMEHEPQIPSCYWSVFLIERCLGLHTRQERRKVRVGSCSFLILIKASNIIGPAAVRSVSRPSAAETRTLIQVQLVLLHSGLLGRLVGVPAVDVKRLHARGFLLRRSVILGRHFAGDRGHGPGRN